MKTPENKSIFIPYSEIEKNKDTNANKFIPAQAYFSETKDFLMSYEIEDMEYTHTFYERIGQ